MERTPLNSAVRALCAAHYTPHTHTGCWQCPARTACHSSPTVLTPERMEEWRLRLNAAAEAAQEVPHG